MSFITDKQTLEDLNLLGKFKSQSVFSLFNHVKTAGGERLLEQMFLHPLSNPADINGRTAVFRYYQAQALVFPFSKDEFQLAENYLDSGGAGNYIGAVAGILHKKVMSTLVRDVRFGELHAGLQATISLLQKLTAFSALLKPGNAEADALKALLSDNRLKAIIQAKSPRLAEVVSYDYLLRTKMRPQMERLLQTVHKMDVYIAVSDVARAGYYCYPQALEADQQKAEIRDLRHPALAKAIPNSLSLNREGNLLFLTGANMAGKSTFMKSFGIAVYLAHMGFPVAAAQMEFSVRDGLYTSINVPDNLQMGYSHFYAEVQRVKTVAEAVSRGERLIVIFDELFKGTNVKDAYDATLAVSAAFGAYETCLFIISTHIIEVGEALRETGSRVLFRYLPTVMDGAVPRYTYQLAEGITEDRQGMLIVQNEGIIELLS